MALSADPFVLRVGVVPAAWGSLRADPLRADGRFSTALDEATWALYAPGLGDRKGCNGTVRAYRVHRDYGGRTTATKEEASLRIAWNW